MSHQVCHCGWSKVTTYQGLRIHQGKMGCTPKGMRIPESEQFGANSYIPKYTYIGPPIKLEEPFLDIFTSFHTKSDDGDHIRKNPLERFHQKDRDPVFSLPLKNETVPLFPSLNTQTTPTEAVILEKFSSLFGTQQQSHQTTTNLDSTQVFDFSPGGQQPLTMTPMFQTFSTQVNPAADVKVMDTNTSVFGSQHSSQPATSLNNTQTFDFSTGGQQPFNVMPTLQTFSTQVNPAATEVEVTQTDRSVFGTPQRSTQPAASLDKARRALDFSAGALQVEQQTKAPPTTTAQETVMQPKEMEREAEREKERKKEREEIQKQMKAKQDRTRADLQQNIQIREQKMAEVRSSAKACKGKLDAEWVEINSVFSEVMKVVEATRQKALQPLEKRREKVKRDAQDLVQKLQKEIDQLRKTIDDLDKHPQLQVSPQTGLDGWRNVDTSLSFGTLRTTTSTMMEQIHQKLEKLSSVELKRIPKFAVDVKLDPTTAHQCLLLSDDGKKVRDGGKNKAVSDVPQRFDMFGSVLGLNRLTSGKSYWEVEVGNKTGWDLGVARRSAKRKGKLTLNPDNGYWATVHYEESKYAALSAPPVCLPLAAKPQKVGVFVDYEEGLVSFYNVTDQTHIYSFTECSFNDEIFPYFSPHLQQNDKNSAPLIISPVKKQ